jgi:hypothetical membrane protein
MATSATGTEAQPLLLRLLLACGVIGPLGFIVVFLIEGGIRPDYSALNNFVSLLSLGEHGWMQITNFVICGVLVFCFAVGLRRVLQQGKGSIWGPIMLGIFGLSLIGAGLFVPDPLGYPPGEPSTLTPHGALHLVCSLVAFIALPVTCFLLARRFAGDPVWRGWAFYSVATGILVLVLLFITVDLMASLNPDAPAGLVERLTIVVGWCWIALLAFRLMSTKAPISP